MTFGNIFQYLDKEYVYLAETPEVMYVARILSIPETRKIDETYNALLVKNAPNIDRRPVFSYVILETKELKERAAHFLGTDANNFVDFLLTPLNVTLNKKDLITIKEEVTRDGCVSIRLRELVKDIEIG